jgi:general secretion pathway protein J
MTVPQLRNNRTIAGFTLLEALVATALMGMILAALATITAQWLPNWNRGMVRVQRNELVALGLDRLAGDLAAAEFISGSRETRKPFFDGASRSITFVRTALGPNAGPGLEIVRIAEVNSTEGPILVRTRAPFVPLNNDRVEPIFTDPVILLRAPYQLSFSYAGADRNWRKEWRQQVQLPKAIKLTVRDNATQRILSISTATLIHRELPAECIAAKSLAECLTSLLRPPQSAEQSATLR